MRTYRLQTFLLLITAFLGLIGCNQLSAEDRAQLEDLRDRGQALAGTAAAVAPTLAATAQSMAATAVAQAPTAIVDARSAAATVAVNAQALATQASSQGADLVTLGLTIRDQVGNIQPDSNGNYQIELTEVALTALLRRDESAESNSRFDNLNAKIVDQRIILTGDVTRPLKAPFAVVFLPNAQDGVIHLDILEASVGTIQLPEGLISAAENRLNRTLAATINAVPADVSVQHVTATTGKLVISARLNQ